MTSKPYSKKVFFILIIAHLFISSCASRYKKLGKYGGYKEEKISDRTYKVYFEGNTNTSDKKVYEYFIRRSAELALENNFPYFSVLESEILEKTTTVTSEGSPLTKARVTALSYSGKSGFYPTIQKTIHKHFIEGKIEFFPKKDDSKVIISAKEILNKY